MKTKLFALIGLLFFTFSIQAKDNPLIRVSDNDFKFEALNTKWYDGVPLGNGTVGELLWKKGNSLRFALDRIDLWDLHPVDSLAGPNYRFSWVVEHIRNNNYLPVQQKFDIPYDKEPTPCKLPGAAFEISLKKLGEPENVKIILYNALCQIDWKNGTQLQTFVHANEPVGCFLFKNLKADIKPTFFAPVYQNRTGEKLKTNGAQYGNSVEMLGYEQGPVVETSNKIVYHQVGWNGFYYDVAVCWKKVGTTLFGTWSVTSSFTKDNAEMKAEQALKKGFDKNFSEHMVYWKNYWAKSSITIPDTNMQKIYQMQMYLIGSASRKNSFPINLQSVWSADNGLLPAWKGDYHHDMNTNFAYTPEFTSNHLDEELAFINTLWNERDVFKKYTKTYYQKNGINVPGVMSLTGEPMGGWIQYAMSQTIGAWLSQYFYWYWKYSQDRTFLKEKAYPFLKEVSTFLEEQTIINKDGKRTLEFSSSPEFYDNSRQAWFDNLTNNDNALIRFAFKATSELANELGKKDESEHWKKLLYEMIDYDLTPSGSLSIAKGFPYITHRHLSNIMAIYPLGVLDLSDGPEAQRIIRASVDELSHCSIKNWWGFTYPWFANLQARVFDGDGAIKTLNTYMARFCSKNTWHLNGDQTHSGLYSFTDDPVTVEGTLELAAALQEMLIQSHTGVIHLFPAIPSDWKNVSFDKLRTEGGFLVSAKMENGKVTSIRVFSENGGTIKLSMPEVRSFNIPANKWIDIR